MRVPLVPAAVAAAVMSVVPWGLSSLAPARVAVAAPTDTTAVVHLTVGGDRATAQTLAPLAGVTFGLFSEQPTAVGTQGDTTQAPAYTCVSDAQGDCSLSVPLGGGGSTPGTRLWAAPTTLPAGWTTQPDQSADFRTGPLYPGRTETLHSVWPLTRTMPALARGCAHAVGVVTGAAPGGVVTRLATMLQGTPSRIAWYGAAGATDLMPVASAADATRLTGLVHGGGKRSWRHSLDALAAAAAPAGAAPHYDLVVVPGGVDLSGSPAVNRLAALGTRVVSIGDVAGLRAMLRRGCGPSVTLVSPTPLTVTPAAPADAGATPVGTDPVTGAVALAPTPSLTLSVSPTAVHCTDLRSGAGVPTTLAGTTLTFAGPPVTPATPVTCSVTPPGDGTGSLQVGHRWAVTTMRGTTIYAEGTQPADLHATLTVAGRSQPWAAPRSGLAPGVAVPVADAATSGLPGCTVTGTTVSAAGGADQPLGATLTAGAGWTITDHVTCHSHLTLQASVVGGSAQPSAWTLTATGSPTGPSGASGSPAATGEVAPGTPYALSQTGGTSYYVPARTDCQIAGPAIGWDTTASSVTVPLGQDVTCTTTEATAALTLSNAVTGSTTDPADWSLTATPGDPHPAGIAAQSVKGTGTITIRPALPYTVRQASGAAGYQLTGLTCTVDGVAAVASALSVPAGSAAACTATTARSEWTVTQSSDPASGSRVVPGDLLTYTVTATHLTGQPTSDVLIEDDLTSLLRQASVVDGAVTVSTGTAELDGDRLTWTLPSLTDTATATFRVRVGARTDGTRLVGVIARATTTEPGGAGDAAIPCAQTALSQTTTNDSDHRDTLRCDAVVHPTLDAGGPTDRLWWFVGGALAVSLLGTATAAVVSRRRTLRG